MPFVVAVTLAMLAIVMTWPLLPNLHRAVSDPGDPYINTFTIDWVNSQWSRGSLDVFDAPVFYPAKKSLAFTEHLIGLAVLAMPLHLAHVKPLTIYNILFLLAFVANGVAAYLLAWHITQSHGAATISAITYAFLPYRMGHASHLHHLWSPWLPLALWALLRLSEKPTRGRAMVLVLIVTMLGLSNVHWLLFGVVALAFSAVILLFTTEHRARFATMTGAAVVVAALLLLPTLLPYRWAARHYGMVRSQEETLHYSAQPADWTIGAGYNKLYGWRQPDHDGERRLFPGVVLTSSALIAILFARSRYRSIAVAWLAIGFLGSLGLNAFFHRFLFEHVEVFRAIRVPARWAMIAYTGMAILAGIAYLPWRRLGKPARVALVAVYCACFLWEARTFPVRWYVQSTDRPAVYDWLRDSPPDGGTLELPIRSRSSEYEYLLGSTVHHRPLVNGISGFDPPLQTRFATLAHSAPIPAQFVDELQRANVKLLIVHTDRLAEHEPATVEFLRQGVATRRLFFLGRFHHDHRGDFAFSIGPHPHARDATAALEDLASRRFLQTDQIVGMLDHPRPRQAIRGGLLISGWALSPHGVREVHVLFNNGQRRYRAQLVAKDLTSAYPTLKSHMVNAGFRLEFSERPRGIWEEGDLQIEIIDYANRVARLPQIWFEWR